MNAPLTGCGRESTHLRRRGVGFLRGLQVLLAFLLAAAGLAGCGAHGDGADTAAKLNGPRVFYLSRDAHDIVSSIDELQVRIDTRLPSEDVTVTFHAEDLYGTATIKRALDACRVHLPTFRCHGLSGILPFHVAPAKGAAPGDSAVLRYTMTAKGQAPVEGRTVVVVGRPLLQVTPRAEPAAISPGAETGVFADIRNTGEVPARGVLLQMETRDGLVLADRHRNCRYKGETVAVCTLPASEAVIEPGETFRVRMPERLRAEPDALHPTVGFSASPLDAGLASPHEIAEQFRPGKGSDLRVVLVKRKDVAPDAGARSAADWEEPLHILVHNRADLVALGDTVKGPVGSLAKLRFGVRNDGPGALPSATVHVTLTVPAGTTVVKSPYDPERDEEVIDQPCRSFTSEGAPLAEEPSMKQPVAGTYVCTAVLGKPGTTTTFPFVLHIDKDMADRGGRVTVADTDAKLPSNDTATANDTADIAVQVWPGPAWATLGAYVTLAVLAGLALLALLLIRRRLRHP